MKLRDVRSFWVKGRCSTMMVAKHFWTVFVEVLHPDSTEKMALL